MKRVIAALVVIGVSLAVVWAVIGPDWRRLLKDPPQGSDILFYSQGQRDAVFRMMDRVPFLVESRQIPAGPNVRALPVGDALDLDVDMPAYMEKQRTASLVVLHKGQIRLEAYGLEFGGEGRWTSFSVAKSLTSTLVGAAIKDGHIKSLEDKVSTYVPGLQGSPYDDVTIEQLLTMTSGVNWVEDYEDPNSDVARFNNHETAPGESTIVGYMQTLSSAHTPGSRWNYSTGETNLIGVLVSEAAGKGLTEYLSEKIWRPYGMEADASWLLGPDGFEISGCCIQARTRDFARFGQLVLEGGKIGGEQIVPDNWFESATTKQVGIGQEGQGYGYQWWTYDDGSFQADGIFGQGIFIDPSRDLVIASNASWRSALGVRDGEWQGRYEFYGKVQAAIDAESQTN